MVKKQGIESDFIFIDVKTIHDESGNLSVVESGIDLPFKIERIYYIWHTGSNLPRGSHAHKSLYQAFIGLHGSCELIFQDGSRERRFLMSDPSKILIVPPGYWRDIRNFSEDCVLMVLASDHYNENDYIRDYDQYLEYVSPKA